MKKKTAFMFIGLSALVPIIISVATIGLSNKDTQAMKATSGPYELVLNGSNSPSELTDSYQDKVTTTVKTTLNNDVELGLVLAKKSSGNFATLGHRGMIYNFDSDDGHINGIISITATFSSGAAVYLKTSSQELSTNNGSGVALEDLQLLTSGSQLTLKSPAKYFALIAGDTGATINSLSINYSCSDQGIGFDTLIGTYTGQANNIAYQLSFSRSGNTQKAVYKTLNQETLTQYEGTASISGNNVTSVINGVSYVSQIAQDGRLLSFVSASPDSLPHIDFYRVYNVENFENYSAAGVGYDKNNAKENTTGARSHWFADYQASGSSPVGGSSWSLMGSSDYMQFSTTGGRNNSKYAAFI